MQFFKTSTFTLDSEAVVLMLSITKFLKIDTCDKVLFGKTVGSSLLSLHKTIPYLTGEKMLLHVALLMV